MEQVIIFGTSIMAEVIYYYLMKDSPYEVVAFTADRNFIEQEEFLDLPVVPFEDIEKFYPPDRFKMFVAVGYQKVNKVRARKYEEAKEKGYTLISYVSSKAMVWDNVEIGDNCFIFEGVTIQPCVKIGNDVIVWSGAHIGHHTSIGDHCYLANLSICGLVKIEPYCFLGDSVAIRDGVTIARECIIGMGAVILEDTKEREIYKGTAAKPMPFDSSKLKKI